MGIYFLLLLCPVLCALCDSHKPDKLAGLKCTALLLKHEYFNLKVPAVGKEAVTKLLADGSQLLAVAVLRVSL